MVMAVAEATLIASMGYWRVKKRTPCHAELMALRFSALRG